MRCWLLAHPSTSLAGWLATPEPAAPDISSPRPAGPRPAPRSVEEFARGMSLDVAVDERWMRMVERDMQRGVSLRELEAALGDLGQRGRDVLPVAFNMVRGGGEG